MLLRAAARFVRFCWLLTFVLSFPLIVSAADPPRNLLTNPSLEDEAEHDGYPSGWGKFFSNPAGAYTFSIMDGGRTGKKQINISITDGNQDGQFAAMAANRIPLDRSKRYVARGWTKVAGGERATADVKLHYYSAGGIYLGQTRVGFARPGHDDWQLVTVTDQADTFPDAKLIGLAFACTGDAKAQYDDLELLEFDKKSLPANFDDTYGITLSPQMAILARRLGVWDKSIKIKPCLSLPQGLESTGVEHVRWGLRGLVLETHGKVEKSGHEQLSLMAYDDHDKVYRNWYFGSDGTMPREETMGHWSAAEETITFESKSQDGTVFLSHMKYVGENEIHWQGTQKDKQGKVLMDFEARFTRRQGEHTAEAPAPGSGDAPKSATKPVLAIAPTQSIEATKELDGTWQAESVTVNGEVGSPESAKLTWFKIKETEVQFKIDGPELKGMLTVDTQKTPKWIDIALDPAQRQEINRAIGIYLLKGDQLAICILPADENNTRPDGFTSKKDSRRILVILRKQKE